MIHIDYNIKKKKAILTGDHFDLIREHFSVENPAAKFLKFKRFIPKRIYAITPTGLFDIGLINEIKQFLYKNNITSELFLAKAAIDAISPNITHHFKNNFYEKYPLRDYQENTVKLCLDRGRGVAVLGTGAGKTLTVATLVQSCWRPGFKCLIIVPDLGLVNQTYSDFKEYDVTFSMSKWTGSIDLDTNADIVIANTAIIQSRFEDNDWIQFVDMVIVDEVHKAGKDTKLAKILQKIQTNCKFGFTGTLPESKIDTWNILGKIGPVLITKNSHELRLEDYLTNVEVKLFELSYKTKPDKVEEKQFATEEYTIENEFLKTNTYRNNTIKTICTNFKNNILIMVNHIDHGEILEVLLKTIQNKKVYFIRGEVEVEDRDKIKHIMETENNVVCIAISSIFSTGVNIKNIHLIVFAAGGKSFIRIVQSIGRGLRKHESKEKLIIIDLADQLKYGLQHALKRIEIYRTENIPFSIHKLSEK
jgi:superfamily II DNA or RNA helicase